MLATSRRIESCQLECMIGAATGNGVDIIHSVLQRLHPHLLLLLCPRVQSIRCVRLFMYK